ncbi:MAG: ADP-ribosylglycohydrolase family protein [Bacteroidia bacterium]|jgi:ADP-ribosylglycohydrolase|nr:ADP-ribosylglycohydrolase family protein [Bacteroidia bacterium]
MTKHTILYAIAGDVVGSAYEFNNHRSLDVDLFNPRNTFTDDTVLTVAVADAILHNKDFANTIWEYGNNYPDRGYGGRFAIWLDQTDKQAYNSYGNGSAMRVSAAGFAASSLGEAMEIAGRSAEVTHNHPEGIKGAQATAAALFLARHGSSKNEIREHITAHFGYDLSFSIEQIRPYYRFDETCQGSVPHSIVAFLESADYQHALRLAISLGGDSDTIACIAGGIAGAFYKKMPSEIELFVKGRLPEEFLAIIGAFDEKFG